MVSKLLQMNINLHDSFKINFHKLIQTQIIIYETERRQYEGHNTPLGHHT